MTGICHDRPRMVWPHATSASACAAFTHDELGQFGPVAESLVFNNKTHVCLYMSHTKSRRTRSSIVPGQAMSCYVTIEACTVGFTATSQAPFNAQNALRAPTERPSLRMYLRTRFQNLEQALSRQSGILSIADSLHVVNTCQ